MLKFEHIGSVVVTSLFGFDLPHPNPLLHARSVSCIYLNSVDANYQL